MTIMAWGKGDPHAVGLPDKDVLAESPASGDLIPVYDVSAADGKVISHYNLGKTQEFDGSTTNPITAAQMMDSIVTNYGQAASDIYVTLPTAAAGLRATFVVGTAHVGNKWGIKAGTNDKIYLIALDGTVVAGADNGLARFAATQIGQCVEVWAIKTGTATWDWCARATCIGTSTFSVT